MNFIKRHALIIIVSVLFAAICLCLIPWYQYFVNPDALSYFSIAREYATGAFGAAINDYWGPLFSILLVPAVWCGVDLVVASKILITTLCLAVIITTYVFLIKRKVPPFVASLGAFVLAVLLVTWATYEAVTPDILLALLVLLWAVVLLGFLKKPTLKNIILLAVIGALLYFTKGFGFYLFIGVMGILGLYKAYRGRRALFKTLKPYLLVALFFIILVTPFIVAISIKTERFTINTAGEFNLRLVGPAQGNVYPHNYLGPLTPHNPQAITAWETPDVYTASMPTWSILGSKANFSYYINTIVIKNVQTTITAFYGFGALVVAGFLWLLVGSLSKRTLLRSEYRVMALISSIMLAGYVLVYAEQRYIIAIAIFGTIASTLALSQLLKAKILGRVQIIVLVLLVVASLTFPLVNSLITNRDEHKQQYVAASMAAPLLPKRANIISNDFQSYQLCYFDSLRCYGVLTLAGRDPVTYASQLKAAGVQFYVDYAYVPRDAARDAFVATYFDQSGSYSGDLGATIYTLK